MNRICALMAAFACFGMAADLDSGKKPAPRQLSFTGMPLSFEPNVGQADPSARFVAKSPGYTLRLESTGARFQFDGRDKASASLRMDFENANRQAAVAGESLLAGKDDYFPTKDPKTWFTNIPTYSRVRYSAVYPGVDLAFYGNANRLEYDFLLQAGADPAAIRMKLSGSDQASIDGAGDLLLRLGKGDMRFLKPVAYQTSSDGKSREPVQAGYKLERNASGEPVLVSFSIGSYDHARPLVIDPVVLPSLVYSEYVSGYAGAVTVDSSGNTYVTGQNSSSNGFYVTKFSSTGTVVYNATVGSGPDVYPYAIAVDSTTGQAYVAGYIYSGATLPTSANAYQSTVTAEFNGFLAVIASGGASVPYATYLGGTNSGPTYGQGIAVDSSGDAYLTGYTDSATFPTTSGAYQTAYTPSYDGFVSKINPTAATGPKSLVYSTLLGPGNTYLYGIAVDSSGDAYVTGNGASGFPVTAGAFQYSGVDSADGGVYVTELNTTGTALVYSAYLGYGTGYGIAVEQSGSTPSAYVTGTVGYADFPTTAGAYQTSYAAGFVTKLSSTGTETYSTFLGGPSSYAGGNNVFPSSIALPIGCTAATCNAYVAGWTNTTDFPMLNAIDTTAGASGYSAFVTELAANGASALFSSYLNGVNSGVYNLNNGSQFGLTPSIAVDSSGNMSVAGNTYSTSDFPITISNANPTYAFLAKIGETSTPFTLAIPKTVIFPNQPVGVNTSVYNGTMTVRLDNLSATTATLSSIQVSPSSVFSESDNCNSTIAAGGYCTLSLNFTPNAPSARTGTVTITSNASDSPTTITLTGTGYDTAFVEPSQSSLTFGNQAVGTSSAAQAVTITNLGDQTTALNIYTNTGDFSTLNNCPPQLLPGASCTANVTFSPTQPGLRTDTLTIYSSVGPNASVSLSGSGTISGGTSGANFTAPSLVFGPQTVSTTSTQQVVYLTNNGTEPLVIQSATVSGNFTLSNYCWNTLPYQVNPQASCYLYVTFSPTTAGPLTGTLTITDSASGSPHTLALSGTGVASTENVEFYPSSSVSFPDTPVGATSGSQLIYLYNTGTSSMTVDRVEVSAGFSIGSNTCEATTIPGVTSADGSGSGVSSCYVYVYFKPTATGPQTGTLTFVDSAPGSPHVVNLTGNGITATGTISLNPNAVNFNTQVQGTTSAVQYIYLVNPGNTPVTVTAFSLTGSDPGDYSVSSFNCSGSLPYVIPASTSYCYVGIQFTPMGTGARAATLTVANSAGNQTASLTGTGLAVSQAIGLTPTSMNLGSIVVGQSGAYEYVYLRNTGTEAVTFSANPAVTGTNAADFTTSNSCAYNGYSLAAGSSCYIQVRFTPSVASAESATLTFTDSASPGTQTLALSGTGVSTKPTYTLSDYLLSYNTQVQGTTSPVNTYFYFYNNGATSVALGNVGITGQFLITHGDDSCSGQTIGAGSYCSVYVQFAPTSAGYQTGTLTFNNSGGTALAGAPTVPLAGFAAAPAYSAYTSPSALNFTAQQVIGTTSPEQTMYLYNTGNTSLTVGTVSGTDLGVAGSTAEFSIYSANGGYDGCTGQPVAAGSYCQVEVTFTPNAAGARTGTISFPVTYSNSTTANITANLSGTGVTEKNSAVLTPPNLSFLDQAVSARSAASTAYLNNSGNQPFTVGTLSNTNTTEFSTASANGGYDGCTGTTVQPGSSCQINVTFTPSATGARTGSITFPVTFKDSTTASPTLALTGTGVASAKTVQITPGSIQFPAEIQSDTTAYQTITVTNRGNQTVTIGADSISTNSAEFAIYSDSCAGSNLGVNASCNVYVNFTPSSSATGTQTGVLTIGDNATGGPHTVALSGTAITASQQIVVSQTTVAFGNQPAGSTSSPQLVYFTNQSDTSVTVNSVTLGGTNAADFQIVTNTCSSFSARSSCYISVQFIPPVGASGALTATITVTGSDSGSPHTITLTGTAVAPGPAAALNPSTLTFPTQNVGSTSAVQNFSVTNTGSANLTITSVASTNTAEFPIYSDGCSGTTLTPKQHCVVGVQFSPTLGGARSGTIKVTDNATGSPQSLAVTGTGYGIPTASLNPTTLTYASTTQGTTTAAQSTTLSNSGTDTLDISSIAITGPNAGDFLISANTCGATLAPAANCKISVEFDPTTFGSRTALITVTDNANNVSGSTQNVTLNGPGVGLPTAGVSGALTFSSTSVGATSASQPATLTNSGGATLAIKSIGFTGTDPGDFTQTNNCGITLAAGASCTISVSFKPAASGSPTANLTFTDNSGGVANSTQNVGLTGTAVTPVAPTATSVSPNSGTGAGPQSFVFTYTDTNPGGYKDLKYLFFTFFKNDSYANACYGFYVVATNQVILYNNAATASAGYITPGGTTTVANSQCSITGAGTSAVGSGNTMTLTLPITFSTTFPGTMNILGTAYDNENQDSATTLGTWNTGVEQPPTVVSVSPNSGSGLGPQVFTFTYSDPNGTGDLNLLYFDFAPAGFSASHACYGYYQNGYLVLYNDAGNGTVPGYTIVGTGGTLSNSQCSLSGKASSVSTSGNNISVSVSITFTSAFATGSKNVLMEAIDKENENTGWINEGTWTP